MRMLSKRQKQFLDRLPVQVNSVDTMSSNQWEALQAMGDFELIHQCTDQYLGDRYWREVNRTADRWARPVSKVLD